MIRVFTDFHHAALLNSLIMLFEGRIGGQVYRPIGKKWHELGYWKIYDHPATIEQYLGINGATPDGSEPLNEIVGVSQNIQNVQWYDCRDIDSDKYNKAITFDIFMAASINLVIASIPEHIEPFRNLCNTHPSKPKLIYQIGNSWNITPEQESMVDGIMSSARLSVVPKKPYIEYHQEFDLSVFRHDPGSLAPMYTISSFINCFNLQEHFSSDWKLFEEVERLMDPYWKFYSYGGGCRDGAAHGTKELADKMKQSRFIWHTKNGGDGYGHVLYNSAAVGRPLITKKSYYVGKLGEELMIDGLTCIDIDNLPSGQIVDKILHYAEHSIYQNMCESVYNNFKQRVNFDEEFIKVSDFLNNIL